MARFGLGKNAVHFACIFFGAKLSVVLTAVFLLSIVDSRSTYSVSEQPRSSRVYKFVEEQSELKPNDDNPPKSEVSEDYVRIEKETVANQFDFQKYPVFTEFLGIISQLLDPAVISSELMQGDQPQGDQPQDVNSRDGKTLDSNDTNFMLELKKQEALDIYKQRLIQYFLQPGNEPMNWPSAKTNYSDIQLPIWPIVKSGQKREAIPPICKLGPHKNEDNLTVTFNISQPKPASKNNILSVISAELKIYKMPIQLNGKLSEDDSSVSKWGETFSKSDINASESVIKTKAEEEKMIQITIYKIRNKSQKNSDMKKLDVRMLPASYEGVTTWNITRAINIWGNDTKRTLSLVIAVEDEKGNKLPTRDVFQMKCTDKLEKPFPIPLPNNKMWYENRHGVWIDLTTEEVLARTVAYNGAASSVNHFTHEYYKSDSRKEQNRNRQASQVKETSLFEYGDKYMTD